MAMSKDQQNPYLQFPARRSLRLEWKAAPRPKMQAQAQVLGCHDSKAQSLERAQEKRQLKEEKKLQI